MKSKKDLSFDDLANRMQHLVSLKKYEYALKELEEMRKQNPDSMDVQIFFPYVNFYQGKYNLAIEQAESVLAKNIGYPTVYYILAQSYLKKSNYKKFGEITDLGLSQHPNDVPLISCKVRYLALMKKENEALKIAEIALGFEPKNPQILNMKARILESLQKEGGEEILDLSIANDPMNASSHVAKGQLYFNKRDYEKAKECFLAALKIDPENKTAREHLNSILCITYFPNHFKVLNFYNRNLPRIFSFFVLWIIASFGFTAYSKFTDGSGSWFLPISIFFAWGVIMYFNHIFQYDAAHHLSIHEKTKQFFQKEESSKPVFTTLVKLVIAIIFLGITIYFQV
jgi:tetratricopeptide (TPR) repeat protein